jgi:glutamine synthetase
MSGNVTRLNAIAAINSYEPIKQQLNFAETPTRELFNANVLSTAVMKERLPKSIYKSLMRTIENVEPLDLSVADAVANEIKDWSIE